MWLHFLPFSHFSKISGKLRRVSQTSLDSAPHPCNVLVLVSSFLQASCPIDHNLLREQFALNVRVMNRDCMSNEGLY